jgi:hypothetical protein
MRDTKRLNSYDPKGMDNFKQLSLANQVLSERMVKKQQMRRT